MILNLQDCLVKCNEYIRLKKKICEGYGEPMSLLEEDTERRHFLLMDTDHSGSITWNEFINYEAPSLLSKKNKVELSNYLTLRELILIKKTFLSFDKRKFFMISKDEAKSVYIEYIQKLRFVSGFFLVFFFTILNVFFFHLKNETWSCI